VQIRALASSNETTVRVQEPLPSKISIGIFWDEKKNKKLEIS
jgi:hypothetical protein